MVIGTWPLLKNAVDDRGIFVGMDVGHPGPGVATRPSVASLVASVDWDCTKYVAFCGVQEPRVEMIQNLEDMLTVCLPPSFGPKC